MKKRFLVVVTVILVLASVMLFAACTPASDPDKAAENLDNAHYYVVTAGGLAPSLFGIKNVTDTVVGTYVTADDFEFVTILYFETSADAKAAVDKAKEYAAKEEKDKEKEQKKDKEDSDWVFGRSGKMIWFGTKAAVKASR